MSFLPARSLAPISNPGASAKTENIAVMTEPSNKESSRQSAGENTPDEKNTPSLTRDAQRKSNARSGRGFFRRTFSLLLQCLGAIFLILLIAALIGVIQMERWARRDTRRPGAPLSLRLEIKPGASMRTIARQLDRAAIVHPAPLMMALILSRRADTKMRPGEYLFAPGTPPLEVIYILVKGSESQSIKITIPEGWTNEQIAQRLAEHKIISDRDKFLQVCADSAFLNSLDIPSSSTEGFLFPSTYFFLPGTEVKEILRTMTTRFGTTIHSLALRPGINSPQAFPLDYAQSIVLASILEREAADPAEMVTMSSVFHNRLRLNMPLGSCATVRFALNKWDSPLTMDDLKTTSPYNTYLHPGLPPAPICNPGKAAINAAFRPIKSPYLYFVYKGNRHHEFSETLREHEAARNKYKDLWLTWTPKTQNNSGAGLTK